MNTLVAYLYDEGIRHAVRRVTPKKLAALQKTDELFASVTYLYSSKKYLRHGNEKSRTFSQQQIAPVNGNGGESAANSGVDVLKDVKFSMEENEGAVSWEEISRGRFARAAKARENRDSMLRALFVEEDIAEETMRVMETVRNESWQILRDTKEIHRRHTAAEEMMLSFLTKEPTSKQRWDLIEDYFLGHDEVVEQALGMEEQN